MVRGRDLLTHEQVEVSHDAGALEVVGRAGADLDAGLREANRGARLEAHDEGGPSVDPVFEGNFLAQIGGSDDSVASVMNGTKGIQVILDLKKREENIGGRIRRRT